MIELVENQKAIAIQGDYFRITFFKQDKKITIESLSTQLSITGLSLAINIDENNDIVPLFPEAFEETPNVTTIVDELGSGSKITMDLILLDRKKDISIQAKLVIRLFQNHDFCTFQLILPESMRTLSYSLHSISPFQVSSGSLTLNEEKSTHPENVTFFEHGFQSWSYTKTQSFDEASEFLPVDVLASIHQNRDNKVTGHYVSEFVTAISDTESKGSLILGFCTLENSFSRIVMDQLSGPSQVSWLSAYSQFDCIPINRLKTHPICSEELFISFKSNNQGYLGLVDYAQATQKRMNVEIQKPRIGWCSWYYYYTEISDIELIKNVKFFERSPDIPIDMIQLDDGYFTAIGDYTSFNDKFPNGLSKFVDLVHKQGKTAGIWIAPFFAAENSELVQNHPDWFLRSKKDQELLPVCYNWDQIEYALDLTRPDVQKYLKMLIHTIINIWHFDFIKIDFIYAASVFESTYQDTGLTRAQIYRMGLKLIRDTMGDNKYLLGCGAPLGPSVGLVDAMRVSEDTKELWDTEDDPIYSVPCLKHALIGSIYRSFMHNSFWINDPDCLIVRKTKSKLTEDELKLQITIFGLTGGQLLISDDMEKLEEERLYFALKLIPPFSKTALPIDALYAHLPTVYLLETEGVLGQRALVALMNWDDEPVKRQISLRDILTDTIADQFLIFDWWEEKLIGGISIDDPIELEIAPHGCKYLGIIPFENKEEPLLLSSTLHITQGCQEVKRIESNTNELNITIELIGKHNGDLFVLHPNNLNLASESIVTSTELTNWGLLYKIEVKTDNYKEINLKFT